MIRRTFIVSIFAFSFSLASAEIVSFNTPPTNDAGSITSGFIDGSRLGQGSTSYIQNTNSLQAGSTFYVASGSVDGQALLARTSGNVGIRQLVPIYGMDASTTARITGETLLATASGNVGISTSAPTYRLDVAGTMRTSGESILAADGDNVGIATRTPAAVLHVVRNGGRIRIEGLNTGSVGTFILNGSGGSWDSYIGGTGNYILESTRTIAMTILPGGNVGIATGSPAFGLDVSSTARITGETLLATTSGNVGITTGTPAAALHVVRNGGRVRVEGLNTSTVGTFILNTTGGSWDSYISGSANMVFESTAVQAMTLMPGGYIGIGTAAPATQFHISGTNPILRLGQSSNCATATPGAVGEMCVQNSATQPVWFATATTVAGFQPVTLAAE